MFVNDHVWCTPRSSGAKNNRSQGVTENYTYYSNNLLKELVNREADGSIMESYSYTYDGAHNQTSKSDAKGTTSYSYDSLNRLEKVSEPNGRTTGYTYDKAGNRLTETVMAGTASVTTTYLYNEQNRLMSTVKQSGSETITDQYKYDNNGNTVSKTTETVKTADTAAGGFSLEKSGRSTAKNVIYYKYDAWNQLIKTTAGEKTITNTYNGEGYRVSKTENERTTNYLYEEDKVILETDVEGNETARNVYGINLLTRTAQNDTMNYMYNGHGDVTALLGENGTVQGTYYYDAFGNITEQTGSADNNITYAGYQYDKEIDLYYLNARMYDAKTARFLTEDTYAGDPNDPLSLNLYTYCENEPVMYDDPSGHKSNRVLDYGDTGDMVIAVQEKLLGLHYSLGGYSATGNYLDYTRNAVKKFQKNTGLPVTGVVDNRTMNVLCAAYSLKDDDDHYRVYKQLELVKQNSKAGDIPGNAVLMSQDTYEKAVKQINKAKQSSSDPANTIIKTEFKDNKPVITAEKKNSDKIESKATDRTETTGNKSSILGKTLGVLSGTTASMTASVLSALNNVKKVSKEFVNNDGLVQFFPESSIKQIAEPMKKVAKVGTFATIVSNAADITLTWTQDNGNTTSQKAFKTGIQAGGSLTSALLGGINASIVTALGFADAETGGLTTGGIIGVAALDTVEGLAIKALQDKILKNNGIK